MKGELAAAGEFPQIAEMADPARAARVMGERLAAAGAGVSREACVLEQLHYKPGASCTVVLRARLVRPGEAPSDQLFHGRVHADPEALARERERAAADATLVRPERAPAWLEVPAWRLLLYAFPNDPKLPGLASMADPAALLEAARARPGDFGLPAGAAERVTWRLIRYVPGRRCGAQVTFALAEGRAHAVYGRIQSRGRGHAAFEILHRLWESDARRTERLLLPEPYAFDAGGVFWQQWLAGARVGKEAGGAERLPERLEEVGARLAALHGARVELPPGRGLAEQVGELERGLAALATGERRVRVEVLGRRLRAAAERLGPGPACPIHGEMRVSHAFATERGIALIDFDEAGLGDPHDDLGRVLSDLHHTEIAGKLAPDAAESARARFLAGYAAAAAQPASAERLRWYAASHLVANEAWQSVKHKDRGLVDPLLARAERLMDSP